MILARGASGVGTVIAVALLVLTTGSTVFLAVKHQRMVQANRTLAEDCASLRQDRDEKIRTIESLSSQRAGDQSEITRLRQSTDEKAAAVSKLREQVSSLEARAGSLQDEIAKARADGSLKEGRIAELARQLEDTRGSADTAQKQLKVLGYTKDELNDQVSKLQTRLTDSKSQLDAALILTQQQQKTIEALHGDLESTKVETVALRQTAEELKRELDLRPRPSVSLEPDAYKPSRDRKAKAGVR